MKDLRLDLIAGEAVHVPMPLADVLGGHLLDALAHGEGELRWAALA